MNTSNARKTETKNQNDLPFAEFADQAVKQYEQALRAGLKLQGEMAECWSQPLKQPVGAQDWQKRFAQFVTLTNEALPLAQERIQAAAELLAKNTRTGTELFQKAWDAAQTPGPAESQSKWMEFWSSSLGLARASTETFTQLNAKAIDSYIEFVRKHT